jgi:hypothetical protein
MLKFMEKRWGFKLKNDNARIKALGLTFLIGESEVEANAEPGKGQSLEMVREIDGK